LEWFHAFVKGFLISLTLCFDLGLVNVAMIKTGMERGFRASFWIGFGSCFGDLTYMALALMGLAFVFQILLVKWALWIFGTLILSYLTYKMLRETLRPHMFETSGLQVPVYGRSAGKDFRFGIAAALSSPTAILWFAAVAGPIAAGMEIRSRAVLAGFMFGFFTAGLIWSIFIAAVSSRTGKWLGSAFVRGVSLVSGGLFLYFAIRVFVDGWQVLWK
jgi:L-lysine exporter family protein LysE/ArgO